MKHQKHIIKEIIPGSIAEELELEPGDKLLAINDTEIEDIFDYQFLVEDEYIDVLIEKEDGEQLILEIEKEADEDLGIVFENGLMDDYRSCHNKCIFCFIDQMPKGMRDTLYFKDDDSRLSFLQGNYVTLTNMSDHDINRIVRYHLGPINISIQTMNKELRCKMLNNRFAGEALEKLDVLYQGGIEMNGQIVLCKGVNDAAELDFSIRELEKYLPYMRSVSVVPSGLTKYREGLFPLEPFTKEDARNVISQIETFQTEFYNKYGLHFIHASDEWYILAGLPFPEEERYDGYIQLENGVGMMRLLQTEFDAALKDLVADKDRLEYLKMLPPVSVSMATGRLAYPMILQLSRIIMEHFPNITIHVYEIVNYFFGESITVSGLITGQDLVSQLRGHELGNGLLLPCNILRSGEEVFLDDYTLSQVKEELDVDIRITDADGQSLIDSVLAILENIPAQKSSAKDNYVYIQTYDKRE